MSGEGFIGQAKSFVLNEQRGDLQIAYGTHTNVAASDTVDSGMSKVLAAFAIPKSDPAATASVAFCSCDVGDQAGTPASGSFLLKSWEADGTAATSFGEDVQWIAIGY